jgi:NADH dehydrogenase
MTGKLIVIFGANGFIGRHVVRNLTKRGYRVRAPMRRPHLGGDLRVAGDVGQVQIMQANIRFPESVGAAVKGADGVINLVGLLYESGKQTFKSAHVDGPCTIAEACKREGVNRLVHISAIGADPGSRAKYAKTKGEGEGELRRIVPETVILRPSIIFGSGDGFFNRFADMAKMSFALPLIGGGKTKFQPVYVQDVADAILAALERDDAKGKTFELGGPQVYSFKELMAFTTKTIARPRLLAPLPFFLAQPLGMALSAAFKLWPFSGPPLTGDQVQLLKTDNVVSPGALGFKDLGITQLETIEAIVPSYLWKFRPYGQFQTKQQV